MLVFNKYFYENKKSKFYLFFYKNKKSKLYFGDRVAVLNDFIYQIGGSHNKYVENHLFRLKELKTHLIDAREI
jgi:hypothetical protein